jgi:hypothetical protein
MASGCLDSWRQRRRPRTSHRLLSPGSDRWHHDHQFNHVDDDESSRVNDHDRSDDLLIHDHDVSQDAIGLAVIW